ncbi:PQ-loop domain-containing transporter [Nitrospirillum amazonense]|uniref:PQ loop repeat protein n=1 Tax=Nitrospirillum amazonense TaxID=28077 RepID=A0A560JA04_9PROT|nr:PQ-loop domain-containing transporter [Nitrospirillum amazonense]MDG3442672.1 PQ-loop domain-containing transporter [Nitrospirillum amazonense]TWB67837.1 PQ loop repeat protein [Nitrospirillum amazonense]
MIAPGFADLIGWLAALLLFLTLACQIWTQWRERSTKGVSPWLFTGQIATSIGFVTYSWLLGNWVFVTTNALILATAVVGQGLYLSQRRAKAPEAAE